MDVRLKPLFWDRRRASRAAGAALLSVLCTTPFGSALAEQMEGSTRSVTENPSQQIEDKLPASEHQAGVIEGVQTPAHTKPQAGQMAATGMPATPHQVQVVKAFRTWDSDGDGRITADEWEGYRKDIGQTASEGSPESTRLGSLDQVDLDGDGYVSNAEAYRAVHPDEPVPSTDAAAIMQAFEQASFNGLDQNSDGQVSIEEARMGSLLVVDNRVAYDYIDSDKNGDGNLSADEFSAFHEGVRRRVSQESAARQSP